MVRAGSVKLLVRKTRVLPRFAVVELDAPKLVGIAGRGRDTGEDNGLIANDPGRPVGRMRIKPAELGIGFGSQDEEAAGLVQGVEAGEVQVGPVHDVEGAGLGQEQVHDLDVVELAIGDVDESRNSAAQVQQGMQLDRRLGLAEVGPREQRQAEIDGGRIQSVDGVVQLQTEVFVPVEAGGPCG